VIVKELYPIKRIPRPKVPEKIVQDIPFELIQKALDEFDGSTLTAVRNRAIILMFLDTDVRLSGCANLTLSDVNPGNGIVKV
jgi:integrase/recombinase XerD